MASLIYWVIIIAIAYYCIEGIVLPNVRSRVRYEFFALRDRVVMLKANKEIEDSVYRNLMLMINNSIRTLSEMDLIELARFRNLVNNDPKLGKSLAKKTALLMNSDNSEVRDIYNKLGKIGFKTVLFNSSGFVLLLLPIIITSICLLEILNLFDKIKEKFYSMLERLLLVPSHRINFT